MMPRDDERPDDDDTDDDDTDYNSPVIVDRATSAHRSHEHDCDQACGCVLTCQDADRCRVRGPWTCPSCSDHIHELQITELATRLGKD
ncbi:MAG TPA: hypothetical protein VM487_05070 [Phycisphaerae bacterium]|nr:hypothetical protein [Phycisphaerae bacterium]